MITVDQNNASVSLDQALVPGPLLVDGRTEEDRLAFLAEFASLINFYDQNNQVNGNWAPFLLKDPVFLVAYISRTPFVKIHTLYLNACNKLDQLISLDTGGNDLSISFNQLFDQINRVFFRINQWMSCMQKTGEDYPLSDYVFYQVRNNFSPYFWALRSLQNEMASSVTVPGTAPAWYDLPDSFSDSVWTDNKDKQPYWEVLGLKHPLGQNTTSDLYVALTAAGNKLFAFFQTLIRNSSLEFETLRYKRSHYPDTTLLRTFVDLLKIHQQEMNGLTGKHLDFYYREILKEKERPAMPDSACVYATLAKPNATFTIPKNTLLNAGPDAQKNPIVFETTDDVCVNPASITGAYTLTALQGTDDRYSLYLNTLPAPGKINKDENGKIEKWQTFGGSKYSPAVPVNMGFAFASPLLLLREGQRNISINIGFDGPADILLLQKAQYFLSTQKAWLDITPLVICTGSGNTATININLDPTQPPIEAFIKNPDGMVNPWPMMKIRFASFSDLANPPLMQQMQLMVTVEGVQNFQLYNDYGGLSTKTPFPLFGPSPLLMNSFIIGNAEIFSKPFTALVIELNWDQLPSDLSVYYQQYNLYLQWLATQNSDKPGLCERIKAFFRKIFRKKTTASASDVPQFGNFSHTAGFELLSGNNWDSFNMNKVQSCTESANGITCTPYTIDPGCPQVTGQIPNYLFTSGGSGCTLQPSSVFACTSGQTGFVPNPLIQNSALKFTDESSDGFMKMNLTGFQYGFGSALYPGVVSYIALTNADAIVHPPKKGGPKYTVPANIPFVPKVSAFTASYSASQVYKFDYAQSTYPLQCYFYTPFGNYLVYDNTQNAENYSSHIGTSITSPQKVLNGLPLFAFMDYQGILFLQTTNLLPAPSLNLYFELARNYVAGSTQTVSPDYFCLGTNGWEKLQVLSDGTNALACSGIVKLDLPADPDDQGFMMPAGQCWLSVAVKDQPAAFSETYFLTANGFMAQRSGNNFLTDTSAPVLSAGSITKPVTAIPQISTLAQPFSSFGGRAAETGTVMNQRVSNRLKTKDRVLSQEDYFRLIRQEFPEIYFVKTNPDRASKTIRVLLVKGYESPTEPNAFTPMASECTEDKIKNYLLERIPVFVNPNVSNFDFQYVKATVSLSVQPGFEFQSVQKNVVNGINIFMSPWISAQQEQVPIDQGITNVQVADFVRNMEGVSQVNSVTLSSFTQDRLTGEKNDIASDGFSIAPANANTLLVPYTYHVITQVTT